MRRAQGEMQLQRDQLRQSNTASQFDLGQQQFNASASNQAAQFTAGAMNQAAQFEANAINQAEQFGAQATNQFALTEFGTEAQMNQFNAGQQNQFTMADFRNAQAMELAYSDVVKAFEHFLQKVGNEKPFLMVVHLLLIFCPKLS